LLPEVAWVFACHLDIHMLLDGGSQQDGSVRIGQSVAIQVDA